MKQHGRKSAASLGIAVIDSSRGSRPAPPAELSETEAATWARIVGAMPPDWFGQEHFDLLTAFCRTSAFIRHLDRQVDAATTTDLFGRPDLDLIKGLSTLRDTNVRQLTALARSMRITQQAMDRRTSTRLRERGGKQTTRKPWE